MPGPGICIHGRDVQDTDNQCEILPGGIHREYLP